MTAAARRKPRGGGDVMDSIYSVVALVLILVACVELGDAATTVEVYRLIQYDIAGSPFGSRLSALNHHAGASPFDSGVNLSRTVLILPVRDLNLTSLKGRTRLRPRLRPPLAPRPLRDRAAWLMRGKDRFVDSVAENLLDRLQSKFFSDVCSSFHQEGFAAQVLDTQRRLLARVSQLHSLRRHTAH
ncbi:uncharacterized protein LOC109829200 isoform X2 [Asparagus officinalis]|uniref:uncharacterized protein LOC109829200 isoform X2 n=1 Tax=Asparagus officinalis TaxID=4686 RepID=UPI00098E64B1|nr:uncharacterized protein LOC109829200 isoform X2 [Asparagus officinalis]